MGEDAPLDVLIVGAGLSGIGCGAWLNRRLPGKSWEIIEARGDLGGTWDLHRYPGIRSDSDLYTFGFDFKPWRSDKAIAGAAEIMAYLREAAEEEGVAPRIRYRRRLLRADWDGDAALWTATIRDEETGAEETRRARWLFGATGYYDYDTPHRPDFPGEADFPGPIIHPQLWPEGLDVTGKRIAVIGSGATAVTLVPALARDAAHVTQVQRTPSYILPIPSRDANAERLKRLLPAGLAHRLARRKNILRQRVVYALCQRYPETARKLIRKINAKMLPEGFDVDAHFNPPYGPWDQRLCAVPDADFYKAIGSGKASIVTGPIARLTETGIEMQDGAQVPADLVIAATGLRLQLFGGATLSVDGAAVDPATRLVFRGSMLSGVPNFAFAIGYTNSSWTLKIGLLCEHFTRLLARMEEVGAAAAMPVAPEGGETRPLMDFGAGYIQRSLHTLPRRGAAAPWEMNHNYFADEKVFRSGPIDDPALRFIPARTAAAARAPAAQETAA
ncbi:flavin-containing monooxygenase [Rhodovulum sp. DZ06]|uniref:flavin-containing monooxygenase n=1 Tax=Rhodovulum sp. DZ06 TaxID=3425126 RepID=UPI003D347763